MQRRCARARTVAVLACAITLGCGDEALRQKSSGVDDERALSDLSEREAVALCSWTNDQLPQSREEIRGRCMREYLETLEPSPTGCDSRQDWCVDGMQAQLRFGPRCREEGGLPVPARDSDCATITVQEYEACLALVATRDRQAEAMIRCELLSADFREELIAQRDGRVARAHRALHPWSTRSDRDSGGAASRTAGTAGGSDRGLARGFVLSGPSANARVFPRTVATNICCHLSPQQLREVNSYRQARDRTTHGLFTSFCRIFFSFCNRPRAPRADSRCQRRLCGRNRLE